MRNIFYPYPELELIGNPTDTKNWPKLLDDNFVDPDGNRNVVGFKSEAQNTLESSNLRHMLQLFRHAF